MCPSSSNGVVGIKPTVGLWSRSGIIPISHSQDTAGPMCRNVRDASILLGALTGVDTRDSATSSSQGKAQNDYTPFLDPAGLKGARIGVARSFTGFDPRIITLLDEPIQVISAEGSINVDTANLDAEASLLGAMLLSRDAIADALEVVNAEHFYKPSHGHVFEAICGLYSSGEPADPVTVAEALSRSGLLDQIGGPGLLLELQASTPATSSAPKYARIIQEHATLRGLIGAANEIAEIGYGRPDDVVKAVDEAESLVFQVGQGRVTDSMAQIRNLIDANLDRLEELMERGDHITGTPTGYEDLDMLLSGLQDESLIIVGSRPAMGKTSFGLGLATHIGIRCELPTVVFLSLIHI